MSLVNLPIELDYIIFSYLSPFDLYNLFQTCRHFYVYNTQEFWYEKISEEQINIDQMVKKHRPISRCSLFQNHIWIILNDFLHNIFILRDCSIDIDKGRVIISHDTLRYRSRKEFYNILAKCSLSGEHYGRALDGYIHNEDLEKMVVDIVDTVVAQFHRSIPVRAIRLRNVFDCMLVSPDLESDLTYEDALRLRCEFDPVYDDPIFLLEGIKKRIAFVNYR